MATRTTPLTACEKLALAEEQLLLLMSGRAVRVVETPQLGRTEFSQVNVADLSRLVEGLRAQCAEEQGEVSATGRRRPVSVEACP